MKFLLSNSRLLLSQICYAIPASDNVNPKGLVLYVGDGSSGIYYLSALGAANGALPTAYQGCLTFSLSTGVPLGSYSIGLQARPSWHQNICTHTHTRIFAHTHTPGIP